MENAVLRGTSLLFCVWTLLKARIFIADFYKRLFAKMQPPTILPKCPLPEKNKLFSDFLPFATIMETFFFKIKSKIHFFSSKSSPTESLFLAKNQIYPSTSAFLSKKLKMAN